MKKSYYFILGIILLSVAIGLYLYPQMPDKMASHWNAQGQVDGYMSKFWGVFLMPLVLAGLFLLFIIIPKIDPLKKNIEKFRKYFDGFIVLITLFLFYLYLLTISWSLGQRFDMGQLLMPAMGVLIFYCGILTSKAKRNWFIGIRTPWTLSSDKVWEKTHRIGGKLFKIAGAIIFFAVFLKGNLLYFVLIPVGIAALYPIIYSYFIYKNE